MMKRVSNIVFIFIFSSLLLPIALTTIGQSTLGRTELFTAPDGSFSVALPKPPKILAGIYISEVSRNEAYTIVQTDYPAPIVDEFELRMHLASIQKTNAKPINYQGYSAISYAETNPGLGTENTGLIFIVKQRQFRLVVKTPILRNLAGPKRTEYEKKTADFFGSFKIGTIPPAHFPAVPPLPDVIGSVSADNVYSSAYLGFAIRLPKGWKIEPLEPLKTEQQAEGSSTYLKLRNMWLERNNRLLVRVYREWNPYVGGLPRMVISAYRPDEPYETLQKYVESEAEGGENWGRKRTAPITTANLGGKEFLTYEIVDKTGSELQPSLPPLKGRAYIGLFDGVYLSFRMTYRDNGDEQVMADSVKSVSFTKPTP